MLNEFEELFKKKIDIILGNTDPAHDFNHVVRVVNIAKNIQKQERANSLVVIPACYLHDFVNLPKNHPDRSKASTISANGAIEYLNEISYPAEFLNEIHHCICAHSFSAKIKAETIEAKIVQDADRLDGLGAIGIYRLFTVSAQMNRGLSDALDHVEDKLRIVAKSMNTDWAKNEAVKRMMFIDKFLLELKNETP